MSDHGIDRYEAQSIAQSEARAVGDEIRRDLEYGQLTDLRRELESVRRDVDELRRELRRLDVEPDN